MLFLGTKKYPQESAFNAFIEKHGGSSNAFTGNIYTAYGFDIDSSAYSEALDQFSQFFKEPLLSPSGVSREMQAIAQEFSQSVENDEERIDHVNKELANPEHPEHLFSTGNATTLSGVSTEYLRQWFIEHYSANRMRLILYSSLPLETLKEIAIANFGDILNTHKQPFDPAIPIFSKAQQNQLVYINPINNIHTLTITWELPKTMENLQETKPEDLIGYVLGYEDEKKPAGLA